MSPNKRHAHGPPMTLGNMRELGVARVMVLWSDRLFAFHGLPRGLVF
jgi:hypothetical protein